MLTFFAALVTLFAGFVSFVVVVGMLLVSMFEVLAAVLAAFALLL